MSLLIKRNWCRRLSPWRWGKTLGCSATSHHARSRAALIHRSRFMYKWQLWQPIIDPSRLHREAPDPHNTLKKKTNNNKLNYGTLFSTGLITFGLEGIHESPWLKCSKSDFISGRDKLGSHVSSGLLFWREKSMWLQTVNRLWSICLF